jgi:aryl-alcohol dehydrogenase-like predicted oxidoreductase
MSTWMSRREFVEVSASTLLSAASGRITEAKARDALPQRSLGRTGARIGILGLGGVGFLTDWTDKDAIARLLNEAVDAGVSYFDTARSYGKSEESLGLLMGTSRRKQVFLATKTAQRKYDDALKEVEASLKALRTNYLDLIQVHAFGVNESDHVAAIGRKDGVLSALWRLRNEKVVRFIGITGHPNCPKLKDAITTFDLDTLLCFMNPLVECRWVDRELLPIAQKKKMGIIGMKTFGGGKPAALVGRGRGKAAATQLLRYALGNPITATIPAVANRQEMRQNLQTARSFTPLTEKERSEIVGLMNPPAKKDR